MLANNYSNLYQSESYKIQSKYWREKSNDLIATSEFEQRFALANLLYIESKKYIGFSNIDSEDAETFVTGESELIKAILRHDEAIIEVLRDAEEIEKATHPAEKLSSLSIVINVCEYHLQKIQKVHK